MVLKAGYGKRNESRTIAVKMRSLRSMCGVSRKDRCRNSDIKVCGLKEDVVTRVERGVLQWLGYLVGMNGNNNKKQNKSIKKMCEEKVALKTHIQTILAY
ncbi:hypothetical protein EVAR_63273_1 [Eumeta japonica]|uniref:Uncharacterized protein n=1 Tax=Eumeta variegata TaxID=151549 RepID=A0A4C1Z012_EUMVA|nr:hypothetical protein EVAR_63273_1 [Eumeta japonica]